MNPLNIIQGFDQELYQYFETELEHQHYSLSFIPDENSISPLCSAMMGNVLVNSYHNTAFQINASLENMTADRICKLFNAEHANVKTITIEAASRVVFQALTQRSDVVMSLDLRKKEHCNSEALAYRFVNFGLDPETQHLNMDVIEQQVKEHKPRLLILSPINYPLNIDYARFADIAKSVGAILWCDISQVAGLVTAGVMPSPLPHADVVTFTSHGALQGPHCSVIISSKQYASAIDRVAISSGHAGLSSAELAALSARLLEMQTPEYKTYCRQVLDNASALAAGLSEAGLKLIGGGTQSHLVVVDTKNCALSARGALESLAECGVLVRTCQVQTADPKVKFDAVRFSTMPVTTRGLEAHACKKLGHCIAKFLLNPNTENQSKLQEEVRELTLPLPMFNVRFLCEAVKNNLVENNYLTLQSDSSTIYDALHETRLKKMVKAVKNHVKKD